MLPGPLHREQRGRLWRQANVAVSAVSLGLVIVILGFTAKQHIKNVLEESSFVRGPRNLSMEEGMAGVPHDMLEMVDFNVDPCEDYYEWACGRWEKSASIPDYQSSWTASFDVADKATMESMIDVLKADEGEAGQYYRSCMNTSHIDALGAQPLQDTGLLDLIAKIDSRTTLTDFLIEFSLKDHTALFSWWVSQDDERPDQHMVSISGGSLSLPDRTYYLDDSENFQKHRNAMRTAVSDVFQLLSIPDAGAADSVLRVETAIARATVDRSVERQTHPTYISVANLTEWCPSFDWVRFMAALGFHLGDADTPDTRRLSVYSPSYLVDLHAALVANVSYADLRSYLVWKVVKAYSPYLSSHFADAMVKLNLDLYGILHKAPRWRKCFFTVQQGLEQHMSQLYMDKFFSQASRNASEQLLHGIKSRFARDMLMVSWMNNETRPLAISKLSMMGMSVGGPTVLETRRPLEITGADFLGDAVKIETARAERERTRLMQPPSRTRWDMASTVVNAYYDRNKNGLFIPAAILQPPFFDSSYPRARNAGSIGTILGHEMTHGFDDQGRQYDGEGRLHKWWDTATEKAYDERAQCIAKQFSQYQVSGGAHVNGELTLGEDIADGGGLKLAYDSLTQTEEGDQSQLAEGEAKTFFLAFAQTWCGIERAKSERAGVLNDEHAPRKWRVNGALADFEPFAREFGCKVGSAMNPGSAGRCVLW